MRIWQLPWKGRPSCQITPTSKPAFCRASISVQKQHIGALGYRGADPRKVFPDKRNSVIDIFLQNLAELIQPLRPFRAVCSDQGMHGKHIHGIVVSSGARLCNAVSENRIVYYMIRAHKSGQIGEAHHPETHLIPLILQVPLGQREKVSIYGDDYDTRDGTCVRDYIHVTDLAQAHILAMEYLNNGGESNIFNLGNGVGFTVKEVIDTARKVTGHPIPAQTTPRRAGDPAQLVASSEKAKTILGWKPQYDDLETIIQSAWKWHESHPNGYGK